MSAELLVAFLSFAGTAVGSIAGVLTANRLTNYRIQQLEQKVDRDHHFAEQLPVIKEQIKVINHRIADIETMVERGRAG